MTLDDRFWRKVECTESCWLWVGAVDRDGYGHFKRDGKMLRAHRVAWEIAFGFSPGSLCVLHRCDNPPCVNPSHLFIGTNADNAADRDAKGRHWAPSGDAHYTRRDPSCVMRGANHPWRLRPGIVRRGAEVPTAKLNEDAVRTMRRRRAAGERLARLADEFGVTESMVSRICRRAAWVHVL